MTKRVTKKAVNMAGTDYAKQVELWGQNNMATQRAFQKYMELKAAYEKQTGRAFNPVPLAKGTKVKRKTARKIARKPTRKQIAARKKFVAKYAGGKGKKKVTRRRKNPNPVQVARRTNPAPKYDFSDMEKQTRRLSSALGKPLKVKTFFGERYNASEYQILWENGRPYSPSLPLAQMKTWLHGAITTALR